VETANKQRPDAPRLRLVEDGPEADAVRVAPHAAADKRKGLVPLRLENGKTLLRCDSDV